VATTLVLDRVGKLGKQFKSANSAGIPWVAVVGPDDQEGGRVSLKEMDTGVQFSLTIAEAVEKLKG
jgi:histidyl-tRNA synthetase